MSASRPIAWGARVSPAFKNKVINISARLKCNPDDLMSCIAFESAGTFSPRIRNPLSNATGLIQFMPTTAVTLGTTIQRLAAMTAVDQLDYVARYFRPYAGRLRSLEDVYMAILWPAAIGKANNHVLFKAPTKTYLQNRGLDTDHNGVVTKLEAADAVRVRRSQGLRPPNYG